MTSLKDFKKIDPYFNRISIEFESVIKEDDLVDLLKKFNKSYSFSYEKWILTQTPDRFSNIIKDYEPNIFFTKTPEKNHEKIVLTFDRSINCDINKLEYPIEFNIQFFKIENHKTVLKICEKILDHSVIKENSNAGVHVNYNIDFGPYIYDIIKENQEIFDFNKYRRYVEIKDKIVFHPEDLSLKEEYKKPYFLNFSDTDILGKIELRCFDVDEQILEKLDTLLESSKKIIKEGQKNLEIWCTYYTMVQFKTTKKYMKKDHIKKIKEHYILTGNNFDLEVSRNLGKNFLYDGIISFSNEKWKEILKN